MCPRKDSGRRAQHRPTEPLLGQPASLRAGEIHHPPGPIVIAQLRVRPDQLFCFVFSENHKGRERYVFLWEEEMQLLNSGSGCPSAPGPEAPSVRTDCWSSSGPPSLHLLRGRARGVHGRSLHSLPGKGPCLLRSYQDSSPWWWQLGLRLMTRNRIIESPRAGAGGLDGFPTNCLAACSAPS